MNEEEKKNGFVFYESWYEGAKVLNPKHRLLYLEAVINYGLYGVETELKGTENALFLSIKPTIKFNKKQRVNGLQGGGTQGNSNARKTTQKRPKNDPNSDIYLDDRDKDIEIEFDKDPPKGGEGDNNLPPAREGFEDFELFGILHNVKLKPAHVRHLHETYGVEIADETIDDLSCKLADGSVNSADHYATLLTWLRYRRRTDAGTVTMSSAQIQEPEQTKPDLNERDMAVYDEFMAWKAENGMTGCYTKLRELAQEHGGVSDDVCLAIGMKYYAKSWHFE